MNVGLYFNLNVSGFLATDVMKVTCNLLDTEMNTMCKDVAIHTFTANPGTPIFTYSTRLSLWGEKFPKCSGAKYVEVTVRCHNPPCCVISANSVRLPLINLWREVLFVAVATVSIVMLG